MFKNQSHNISVDERIIFALDVPLSEAKFYVDTLGSHIQFFKIGLQLFLESAFSPKSTDNIMRYISERGYKIMVDLKFFDIPSTVIAAIDQVEKSCHRYNISFLTIGECPDYRILSHTKTYSIKILAVTVLTSVNHSSNTSDVVLQSATNAQNNGCHGVICSGLELPVLRQKLGNDFMLVVPGIRFKHDRIQGDDQKRTQTAGDVIQDGADHIVIGRPIYLSKNPVETVKRIKNDISQKLASTRGNINL